MVKTIFRRSKTSFGRFALWSEDGLDFPKNQSRRGDRADKIYQACGKNARLLDGARIPLQVDIGFATR
jgi:hypothetical protein